MKFGVEMAGSWSKLLVVGKEMDTAVVLKDLCLDHRRVHCQAEHSEDFLYNSLKPQDHLGCRGQGNIFTVKSASCALTLELLFPQQSTIGHVDDPACAGSCTGRTVLIFLGVESHEVGVDITGKS